MKSKNKKRILALVLSMVLMLSTGISAMAEGEAGKGTTSGKTVTDQDTAGETQDSSKEMETETAEGEKPGEIEKVTETPVQTEPAGENVTEEIVSEAADLYQEFKDEDGNVITTIHAYVPEGAFQAKADQISMEAKLLDSDSENYIKGMMEEKLPENSYLGGYVLYEVNFMVDGVITEPAKAITLTIEGSGLSVTDLSKTKAFYYDPADPEAEGDEDQLVDMGQKADVLNYLAENGVAEDQINTYEYSELDIQNEVANQIGFNTWKSTIYGCYTEAYSAETTFTQEVDGVTVNVTAPEGTFPTAAENVSFTAAAVTEEQDTVISSQLDAKAEELEQEVKGYEAFVLSFTVNGEEMQPQVPVSVSFENTGLPAEDVNGAQSFQLDEENRAVNELEGTVENGTASMTLSQMGTVGYWAYGDAVIEEEDSTSAEDENTPGGTEEKQPEDSVEEDSEAVTDDSQGGTDQKEDGQGSTDSTQDAEDTEEKEDNNEDTRKEDTDLEADNEENKKQEEDTNNIEETGSDKEEIEKENSEDKEEAAEEEEKDTSEDKKNEPDEKTDNEKDETSEDVVKKEKESTEEAVKKITYEDDSVVITVSAEEEGVIPEGAELSVTPIEKTEITEDMSEEEKAEAEKINEQYSFTEEKLNEESEANEEVMEGFLAYDICFLVDGEEVEPSGDVQVVMDFKEAAIPEGVSEDAEVSVKHLKEDESAEDKVVVEDMTEKAAVEATEAAAVKKVELTTDSFSTFSVIWTTMGYTITVHYVNENYQEITGENVRTEEIEVKDTEDIVFSDYSYSILGYRYSNTATIGKQRNAISIYSAKCSDSGMLQYKASYSDSWRNWNSSYGYHVYLIYEVSDSNSATIETINNSEENITVDLFNYTTGESEKSWYSGGSWNSGINKNHTLKFANNTDNVPDYGKNLWNKWTRDSSVRSGIVDDNLVDGFPKLSGGGESLSYLFNSDPSESKTVYSGVNYLFTKDADGYFSFDSDENYAGFDTISKEFTVFSEGLKVFYPFDDYNSVKNKSLEEFHGGSVGLGADDADHYFGMTMSATFFQPKDGKINGNDMVFEFSGDDDVWVFIDNKLILDLGGIHDRASGSINFRTGEVTINGQKTDESMFDILGVSDFDNYSQHTIKFFYLERGNNASNCELKFNLPTIPEDSVMVTKEVTGNNETELDYAQDIDFQFNITKNSNPLVKTTYEIRDENNTQIGEGITDEEGNFTLKDGQSAIFEGFKATDQYEIKEIGASLDEGYEVKIDNTSVEIKDEEGSTVENLQSASTGTREVGNNPSAVFKNEIENTATLYIEKKLESGITDSRKQFTQRIRIGGNLYNGSYTVYDANGKVDTYTAINGQIALYADQKAEITGLPYGITFEVEEVLDGAYLPTYIIGGGAYDILLPKVDENGNQILDEDGNPLSDISSASAKMSGDVTVTVTNHKIAIDSGTTSLTVTKNWEEGTENVRPDAINVTLYLDNNNNKKKDEGDTIANISGVPATAQLTKTNWTHTWSNLPADTNFVVEETAVNSGELNDFNAEYSLTSEFSFKELGRLTSCKNKEYDLGQNNMLLIKLTSGTGYILWTPIDLGLGSEEVKTIAGQIQSMNLSGAGNLTLDNLIYVYGKTNDYMTGVTLDKETSGWHLKFSASSAWAQFWNFQYDRTIEANITNTLDGNKTIDIPVEKVWKGDKSQFSFDDVTVQLYKNGTPEGDPVKITKDDDWKYTFQDLPYYSWDEAAEKYKVNEYSIKETHAGTLPIENLDWLFVDISGNADEGFTITNNVPKRWSIAKVSDTDNTVTLEGAEFTLTLQDESVPKYYGYSFGDGTVGWWENPENMGQWQTALDFIPDGIYVLEETKAPVGYLKSSITWTIEIQDLQIVKITDSNKQEIKPIQPSGRALVNEDVYLYENTPLYSLPSAGGPGIFLYMIGGTLLLIAGSLMIYINRRREVLKR